MILFTPSMSSMTLATGLGTRERHSSSLQILFLISVPEKMSLLYSGDALTSKPASSNRRLVRGLLE